MCEAYGGTEGQVGGVDERRRRGAVRDQGAPRRMEDVVGDGGISGHQRVIFGSRFGQIEGLGVVDESVVGDLSEPNLLVAAVGVVR